MPQDRPPLLPSLASLMIVALAKLVTAPRILRATPEAPERQTVYFANHTSNADTVLIWTALSHAMRRRTRPVAAAEYWLHSPLRRFIGREVFNILPIERDAAARSADPVGLMAEAVDAGSSLILFPEGTRNLTDARLLPFKSGLWHLATRRQDLELVPVWIDNLAGVMPKGEIIPVPLLCTIVFGRPLSVKPEEEKGAFLSRAHDALLALAPDRKAAA